MDLSLALKTSLYVQQAATLLASKSITPSPGEMLVGAYLHRVEDEGKTILLRCLLRPVPVTLPRSPLPPHGGAPDMVLPLAVSREAFAAALLEVSGGAVGTLP